MNKTKTPTEKAAQNPTSRPLAIRAFCWDCMGAGDNTNTIKLIRECPSKTSCPLYSVRPYQTDRTGRQGLAPAIKDKCFMCQGGDADPGPKLRVRDCEITDCPLHPVRPWKNIKGRKAT